MMATLEARIATNARIANKAKAYVAKEFARRNGSGWNGDRKQDPCRLAIRSSVRLARIATR